MAKFKFSENRLIDSSGRKWTIAELKDLAANEAERYGLPTDKFIKQLTLETGWDIHAISKKKAKGLGQFLDSTAAQFGVRDVFDPIQAIRGSAKMMAKLKSDFGSYDTALVAYNWGRGNLKRKGLANAPKETKDYVRKVAGPQAHDTVFNVKPKALNTTVDYTPTHRELSLPPSGTPGTEGDSGPGFFQGLIDNVKRFAGNARETLRIPAGNERPDGSLKDVSPSEVSPPGGPTSPTQRSRFSQPLPEDAPFGGDLAAQIKDLYARRQGKKTSLIREDKPIRYSTPDQAPPSVLPSHGKGFDEANYLKGQFEKSTLAEDQARIARGRRSAVDDTAESLRRKYAEFDQKRKSGKGMQALSSILGIVGLLSDSRSKNRAVRAGAAGDAKRFANEIQGRRAAKRTEAQQVLDNDIKKIQLNAKLSESKSNADAGVAKANENLRLDRERQTTMKIAADLMKGNITHDDILENPTASAAFAKWFPGYNMTSSKEKAMELRNNTKKDVALDMKRIRDFYDGKEGSEEVPGLDKIMESNNVDRFQAREIFFQGQETAAFYRRLEQGAITNPELSQFITPLLKDYKTRNKVVDNPGFSFLGNVTQKELQKAMSFPSKKKKAFSQ